MERRPNIQKKGEKAKSEEREAIKIPMPMRLKDEIIKQYRRVRPKSGRSSGKRAG